MALIAGVINFDRLFYGHPVRRSRRGCPFRLRQGQSAAEIEDTFAPHISIIATNIET
jgi:hypothetical protein